RKDARASRPPSRPAPARRRGPTRRRRDAYGSWHFRAAERFCRRRDVRHAAYPEQSPDVRGRVFGCGREREQCWTCAERRERGTTKPGRTAPEARQECTCFGKDGRIRDRGRKPLLAQSAKHPPTPPPPSDIRPQTSDLRHPTSDL